MRKGILARALPAVALAAALVAGPSAAAPDAAQRPGGKLLRCLSVVGLSDDQKAAIKSYLESQKPVLQALGEEMRADRQALEAALAASPADPCAVGAATLKLKGDREALRAELTSIRTGVEALLTPEQKAKLSGCLAAPRPHLVAGEDGSDEE